MKVLILAAGYGTRLYPLVVDTPKPLLEISGRPLINHILERIQPIDGLTEIIVVTNNKFYLKFLDWARKNSSVGVPIKIVNDGTNSPEDRLGSVGDIQFATKALKIAEDLLVIGGDNLFDYSLEEAVSFARSKKPHVSVGLYDIGNLKEAVNFGVVEIDKKGKVLCFEEKPSKPKSSLIAMCFYYFPKETLNLVNQYLGQSVKSDKAGDYIHWLAVTSGVYGFKFQGKWYDIGSVESYQEAQDKFK